MQASKQASKPASQHPTINQQSRPAQFHTPSLRSFSNLQHTGQLAIENSSPFALFLSPSFCQSHSFRRPVHSNMPEPISILFVCLGNICRSTMAEGVFQSITSKAPYEGLVKKTDSCGTGAYHVGDEPDDRTMDTLEKHGVTDYMHAARKVRAIATTAVSGPGPGPVAIILTVSWLLDRSVSKTLTTLTTSSPWTATTCAIWSA